MKRHTDITDLSGMLKFDPRRLRRFIDLLDERLPEHLHAPKGTLSVALFDDKKLAEIHGEFLSKPTETDVITFEGDPEDDFAGEVCASAERALKCAASYGSTPSRELCLYVAHGYLHLAGVNDIEPEDAAKMRAAEALALEVLDRNFRKPIFTYNDKKL